ncbi:Chk1 protein kinase [Cryptotrichosporon argae]
MKALRVEKSKQKYYTLTSLPVPAPTGTEVLVQLCAAGLCHTDLMVKAGDFAKAAFRVTASHEPAGFVVGARAIGSRRCSRGDGAVNARPASSSTGIYYPHSLYTGINADGAFAEYGIHDARACVVLPASMAFDQAAALTCAGVTIFTAVKKVALEPGEVLGIVGLGALGSLGTQMAKAMGLVVVAVDVRPDPIALVDSIDLKPDITVDATRVAAEQLNERVRAELRPHGYVGFTGVDAVILTSDPPSSPRYALDLVRQHGRFILVSQPPQLALAYNDLIFRNLTVVGSLHGNAADLADCIALCDAHGIRSDITAWRIDEHERMVDVQADESRKGKAVLVGVDKMAAASGSYSGQLRYPVVHGYRIGQEIGGGGFSRVFRAINDATSSVAACKVVNLFAPASSAYAAPNHKELQKEVQVHRSLKNAYILEFLHSEIVDREREREGYVAGLYMVLELAVGGDLFDKIAPDVGVPEDLAKFYFAQLVAGIEFIHERGIAHRDLKPENLLLAANGNLKISDFGLCAVFRHKGKTRLLSGRCGSLPYVAPELGAPAGQMYAAEPVDVWGLGVVLYTLLVGNTPWDEPSDRSPEYQAYLAGEIFQYEPWDRIRGQAKSILLALLAVDPNQRITINDIKQHPWCMTPSQLRREQIADALTQGLRQTGMMAIADPTYQSGASQAYADQRSQRVHAESQWGSQFNQQESQFMRATGNITQGGDLNNRTTRFWLRLPPSSAFELVAAYLQQTEDLDALAPDATGRFVRVVKRAGEQRVTGRFVFEANDSFAADGHTLVTMIREKGSGLHWRAFWWTVVRSRQIADYVVVGDS